MFRRLRSDGSSSSNAPSATGDTIVRPQHSESTTLSLRPNLRRQEPDALGRNLSETPSLLIPTSNQTSHAKGAADPLGLSLVFDTKDAVVDIIFVHGLGGSSRKTWSWNRDPANFWPEWIRHEEGLSQSRVFTFGYNANFADSENPLSTLDFSKGLLARMRSYSQGAVGDSDAIGAKPIIFVAHSMGGLVVKKTLIIGKNNEYYAAMLSRVHGVMFLATPHRGSKHASTLNNVLSLMITTSAKIYVSELKPNSTSIEDINEQFRAICSSLHLVSLYETKPTRLVRGIKKLIVDKHSGVLNYPREISIPIDGDHHTICKFESRLHPNYQLVISLLRQLTQNVPESKPNATLAAPPVDPSLTTTLQHIFGNLSSTEADLKRQLSLAMAGSCGWLPRTDSFQSWLDASNNTHQLLWLVGPPGAGKSILAAKTIEYIQKTFKDTSCQYHFFMDTQSTKRNLASCLDAIASQLANSYPSFAKELAHLHRETGFSITNQTFSTIWDTVFERILLKMNFGCTLYWVIDGVDEADSPRTLVEHLLQMQPRSCIKILLISRPKRELTNLASSRLGASSVVPITPRDTREDLQRYITLVTSEILPLNVPVQEEIVDRIATRAEGSFLWTKLALDSLRDSWHTAEDIDNALDETPKDLRSVYQHMLDSVNGQRDRLRTMAVRVLTWASCAIRPLSLAELAVALRPEFDGFVSLKETVAQICGQFIRVEDDTILLIHSTARQFLLESSGSTEALVSQASGHAHAATVCLQYLSNDEWRKILSRVPEEYVPASKDRLEDLHPDFPFLKYAMTHWAYHVSHADVNDLRLNLHLKGFFSRYVLVWLHLAALSNNLQIVPRAAQHIKRWLRRSREIASSKQPLPQGPSEGILADDAFLENWTTDLIRVVVKFGASLKQTPSAIHKHIPPLCPSGSSIFQIFAQRSNRLVSVKGLSNQTWGDHLAHLSVGSDETATKVMCAGSFCLALVSYGGVVFVWHLDTLQELRRIRHDEWVTTMAVNRSGTLLVTSGRLTFKVWDLLDGQLLHTIPREKDSQTMSLSFARGESEFIVCFDDCTVVSYSKGALAGTVIFTGSAPILWRGCPRFMGLSPDQSKVAIAFPGRPVLICDVHFGREPTSIIRETDMASQWEAGYVFSPPEIIRWSPDSTKVYILYQDTTIISYDLLDDDQREFGDTAAREMVVNPEGTYLLTSASNGTLQVRGLPDMQLVYQLNAEELVRDLAFSPDSQRIIDARGYGCNVWAPDVLIQPDELDGEELFSSHDASVLAGVVSEPVLAEDHSLGAVQITALNCDEHDEFFCVGREDGSVIIHEIEEGERVRKVCSHVMEVTVIEWAPSRGFIASADVTGRVIVKKLKLKEDGKWAVFPVFEVLQKNAVKQIFFNEEETLVLISTASTDHIWDLKKKSEVCSEKWESSTGRRWSLHPQSPEHLIWLEANHARLHRWSDLSVDGDEEATPGVSGLDSDENIGFDTTGAILKVTRPGNPNILLYKSLLGQNLREQRTMLSLLGTPPLESGPGRKPLKHHHLTEVSKDVRQLLGCYRDRFAFLDHDNWICTSHVGNEVQARRRFFLPRDWVNDSMLSLLMVNKHGTLVCPRNGRVAIVRFTRGL